jgi:hypothetical protein
VQSRYAALVRGSATIFPRGFLWLVPVWYLAIAALIVASGKIPSWYTPAVLGGLLVAALSLLAVLATMRNNAFVADDQAIWLGLRAGAARRLGRRRKQVRRVAWPEIELLQIDQRHYGVQVDILLGPAAPTARRSSLPGQVAIFALLMIIPIACLGCSPALLSPRRSPPLYRVRLYDVAPGELRTALTALAPRTVPIRVMHRVRVPIPRPAAPRLPAVRR